MFQGAKFDTHTHTLPCPPCGSTGLCIGGVWADWTTPDWLIESERDWMAVSETVVQILGEPCLLSLLRSSTCDVEDRRKKNQLSIYLCGQMYFYDDMMMFKASNVRKAATSRAQAGLLLASRFLL